MATPKRARSMEQNKSVRKQVVSLLVAVMVTFTPRKKPICIWQSSALPGREVDGRTTVKNRFGLFLSLSFRKRMYCCDAIQTRMDCFSAIDHWLQISKCWSVSRNGNPSFHAGWKCLTKNQSFLHGWYNWLLVYQRTFVCFLLTPLGGENRWHTASASYLAYSTADVYLLLFPVAQFYPKDVYAPHPLGFEFGNRTVSIISRTVRVQLKSVK